MRSVLHPLYKGWAVSIPPSKFGMLMIVMSMPAEVISAQACTKRRIHNSRSVALREHSIAVRAILPSPLQRLFDITGKKGSSTWLTVVPLRYQSHGYHLHKGTFRDSLCLRYGWDPPLLPETCVCVVFLSPLTTLSTVPVGVFCLCVTIM